MKSLFFFFGGGLYWTDHCSFILIQSVNPLSEDNSKKTLRQHHVEDDEERFQADLKKAVRQSLG